MTVCLVLFIIYMEFAYNYLNCILFFSDTSVKLMFVRVWIKIELGTAHSVHLKC